MPKFFVTQDKISDNQIIIDSEDVTHISKERNRAEYKGYTFSGTSKSVQNGVHHSENNGAWHIRNCACETFKMCCENRQ